MKKTHSKSGTLTRLFGKKQANDNLFAPNPPWILPQTSSKGDKNTHDGGLPSFSFKDESGTATLQARPRVRPFLHFSSNNSHEVHGLAVPTPSVPFGFVDNTSLGYGTKVNGNYRMYSSVGDLRTSRYSDEQLDDDDDNIPPPPSMPPPPPPTNIAPPPPSFQGKPPSPSFMSPTSPSPPDFIPPTPVAAPSACPPLLPPMAPPAPPPKAPPAPPPKAPPAPPPMAPPAPPPVAPPAPPPVAPPPLIVASIPSTVVPPAPPLNVLSPPTAPTPAFAHALQPPQNVSKWKSETGLNTLQSNMPSNVTHQISSNGGVYPSTLRPKSHLDPLATLPKSFKVPPPAPARSSSIITQEKKDVSYDEPDSESKKSMARSPIPSSFNPKAEAKLLFPAGPDHFSLKEAIIKRRSMLMMEEPSSPTSQEPNELPKPVIKAPPAPAMEHEKNQDLKINTLPVDTRIPTNGKRQNVNEIVIPNSSDDHGLTARTNGKQANGVDRLKNNLEHLMSKKGEQFSTQQKKIDVNADLQRSDDFNSTKSTEKAIPPMPIMGANGKISHDPKTDQFKEKAMETLVLSPPELFKDTSQKSQEDISLFKNNLSHVLLMPKNDDTLRESSTNARQRWDVNKESDNFGSYLVNRGEPIITKPPIKIAPLLPLPRDNENKDGVYRTSNISTGNKIGDIVLPPPDYLQSSSNPASPTLPSMPKSQVAAPVSFPSSTEVVTPTKVPQSSTETLLQQYKPHHGRQVSVSSMSSLTQAHDEPASPSKSWDSESTSSETSHFYSVSDDPQKSQNESTELKHPVTGEKVEAGSPMALLLAAKERAQKAKLSKPREHRNLSESSSSVKPEAKAAIFRPSNSSPNSFVVKPKSIPLMSETKDNTISAAYNGRMPTSVEQQQADPKPWISPSERILNKLSLRNDESLSPKDGIGGQVLGLRHQTESSSNANHNNSPDVQISSFTSPTPFTVMGNENWKNQDHQALGKTRSLQNLPQSSSGLHEKEAADMQVSSFASPTPYSVANDNNEQAYNVDLIPPPPEFSNDLEVTSCLESEATQKDFNPKSHTPVRVETFTINRDSNRLRFDHNSVPHAPLVSQTTSNQRNYDPYSSYNSTRFSNDPQSRSLIKKRLYMPEPEHPQSYGRAPGASRFQMSSMPYNSNFGQYSSSHDSDARRFNTASKAAMQRRTSMEAPGRSMLPSSVVKEVTQIAQNREYSHGQTAARTSQGGSGSTFTVRPGTRQPISYTQQGGRH
ncbi:uncharacterized protein C6orf132 homolog isoform X2 [Lissotriton helveticus]